MIPEWISPDCQYGKHSACIGRAWDFDADVETVCACECHDAQDLSDSERVVVAGFGIHPEDEETSA